MQYNNNYCQYYEIIKMKSINIKNNHNHAETSVNNLIDALSPQLC